MTKSMRKAAAAWCWLALAGAVAGHVTLAALAVTEYARLGWLLRTRFDLAAVTIMLATAVAGVAASAWVAARAAAGSRALRRLAGPGRRPLPPALRDAAAALGVTGRVDVVACAEAFAVTYRLARPRVLVSTALAESLSRAELTAVLAHERCHLRRRDPLRLLAARLLAGYGCYLPVAGWLAGRLALGWELAADRAAVACVGRGVLAGALLKLAGLPPCPAVAAANPAADPAGSLEARVAQLEDGRTARPRLTRARLAATAMNLALLLAAGVCCVGLSQAVPGGVV